METASTSQLLRPKEAMARLGIRPTAFWAQVAAGRIEVRKLGRASVVSAAELERFINSLPTRDEAEQAKRGPGRPRKGSTPAAAA